MKQYLHLMVLMCGVIVFGACSTTSVNLQSNNLIITNDENMIATKAKEISHNFMHLSVLTVEQKVLELESGESIVYEHVSIDSKYKIKNTYKRALRLIFNAVDVLKINSAKSLVLYEVNLSDQTKLYVAVNTSSKQHFSMIYSINKCLANNAIDRLNDSSMQRKDCSILAQDKNKAIKSRWSQKLIILDGLLERKAGFKR